MRNCVIVLFLFPVMLTAQNVGINTSSPLFHLDVRASAAGEHTFLNLASPDNMYFTRLLTGHSGAPNSSLSWTAGTAFNFGMWDEQNHVYSQVLQLSQLHRVGINTFDPAFSLDVRGLDDFGHGGELQLATPGQTNFLRLSGGRLGDPHPFISFADTDTFHFVTSAPDWSNFNRRITLLPTGNMGIGWEDAAARLHIGHNSDNASPGLRITEYEYDYSRILLDNVAEPGTGWIIAGRADSSAASSRFNLHYLGTSESGDLLTVRGNGNVGISTSNPVFDLDVRGPAGSELGAMLQLATPTQTNAMRLFGGRPGDPHPFIAFTDTDTFHISRSSADWSNYAILMTMTPDGKMGIGEEQPQATLDVAGKIKVTGDGGRAIEAYTSSVGASSIRGANGSTTGTGDGVYGTTMSGDGRGVYGRNSSATGSAYGVYGVSKSESGHGVYGVHDYFQGAGFGVYGKSFSDTGQGVHGFGAIGVYGKSTFPGGHGLYGISTTNDGYGIYGEGSTGIYGVSDGLSGAAGVYGHNTTSGGHATYGVYGESEAYIGYGVYGIASATQGINFGVYGESNSTDGRGVYGIATATSGFTYGVRGESQSVNGRGVYGKATSSSGPAYGVYGYSDGHLGHGVHAAISSNLEQAHAIHAVSGGGSSYAAYLDGKVRITGDLYLDNIPFGDYENMQYDFSTGRVYFDNSSRRYKENIEPLETDFDMILQAQPVQYTRPGNPERIEVGYIAEDMEALGLDHLLSFNQEGQVENFNYEKMILYVVEVVKAQQQQLDTQSELLAKQQELIEELLDGQDIQSSHAGPQGQGPVE